MRLWTLHPCHLDRQGLTAVWREALLAQAVLRGRTRGYRHHPQLLRFREHPAPLAAIATYLRGVHAEAGARGYSFDGCRIGRGRTQVRIRETRGQLRYEWEHLRRKLRARSPRLWRESSRVATPRAHPMFVLAAGSVRSWERVARQS